MPLRQGQLASFVSMLVFPTRLQKSLRGVGVSFSDQDPTWWTDQCMKHAYAVEAYCLSPKVHRNIGKTASRGWAMLLCCTSRIQISEIFSLRSNTFSEPTSVGLQAHPGPVGNSCYSPLSAWTAKTNLRPTYLPESSQSLSPNPCQVKNVSRVLSLGCRWIARKVEMFPHPSHLASLLAARWRSF